MGNPTTPPDSPQHSNIPRPRFEDLPLCKGNPKGSAWGLWGDEDELGTLNLLTPEIVAQASKEAHNGLVVPLNLPLESPVLPMNPRRTPCIHKIIAKGYAHDDEIHLNTQSSSHWDGLRHYPYQIQPEPLYYNGVRTEDISGPRRNSKIGVQSKSAHDKQYASTRLTCL